MLLSMISGDKSASERLDTLALCIMRHAPISYERIRSIVTSYAPADPSTPAEEQRKREASTRRMFERDKQDLESRGIYLQLDGQMRYSIDAQRTYAAPVEITEEQASVLRVLAGALISDQSYPLADELRHALVKLSNELEIPDLMIENIDSPKKTGSGRNTQAGRLYKVKTAIAESKRLKFSYTDAQGKTSEREVEPAGCFVLQKRGYLVAFDPSRDGMREFRLDRMNSLSFSRDTSPFERHPFDLDEWRKLPFQFGGGHIAADVLIEGTSENRARQLTLDFGSLEARDGSYLWHIDAADAKALARWCIEMGPGVTPIAPPEARAAYLVGIQRALDVCKEA